MVRLVQLESQVRQASPVFPGRKARVEREADEAGRARMGAMAGQAIRARMVHLATRVRTAGEGDRVVLGEAVLLAQTAMLARMARMGSQGRMALTVKMVGLADPADPGGRGRMASQECLVQMH
jgi:hypothetical protein